MVTDMELLTCLIGRMQAWYHDSRGQAVTNACRTDEERYRFVSNSAESNVISQIQMEIRGGTRDQGTW